MGEPTKEEIIAARDRCAQIIALYGERYLPIFERLENEIALLEQQQVLLKKAICLGNKIDTQSATQNATQFEEEVL
ncbi:MAG: hypothetical protein MJA31_09685 [Clostridia bacterium]|nr:hypothetical protein [Clostridia bacterium]